MQALRMCIVKYLTAVENNVQTGKQAHTKHRWSVGGRGCQPGQSAWAVTAQPVTSGWASRRGHTEEKTHEVALEL